MDDPDLASDLHVPAAAPAFDVRGDGHLSTPLVFASPHSGRLYPREMLDASVLDAASIRRSEDALVDDLIAGAAKAGAALLTARYARAYMDVNREPYELDPAMFDEELPPFARAQTPRIAAGLGAIAKVVGEGQEIYARKLSFDEARLRIEGIHRPYHAALAGLIQAALSAFGVAVLVDWHSMPSAAARMTRARRTPDFVLGDRFGASCRPALSSLIDRELRAMGYEVARNAPYAGGYTTEFYGDPDRGVHAVQVEINRALYLDEATLKPAVGFDRLKRDLETLFASLGQAWRRLV